MKVKVLKKIFEEGVQTTQYGEPSLWLFSCLIFFIVIIPCSSLHFLPPSLRQLRFAAMRKAGRLRPTPEQKKAHGNADASQLRPVAQITQANLTPCPSDLRHLSLRFS